MTFMLLRFRLRQIIPPTVGTLLRFLAPDFLVGVFLALSSAGDTYLRYRCAVVAGGVALFTLMVQTRKLFFTGGDIENFYFVQPTIPSRIASMIAAIFLDLLVAASVLVPVLLIYAIRFDYSNLVGILLAYSVASCCSMAIYFIFIFIVSALPARSANVFLTFMQILMALILLSCFQLSAGVKLILNLVEILNIALALLIIASLVFVIFPFCEILITKLGDRGSGTSLDLSVIVERVRKILFIRSEDEEAGFIIFLSNLLRAPSFRLSTIGTAAATVVVAIYWSMQNTPIMQFILPGYFVTANLVAPIASLAASGVLVTCFLANSLSNSADHEAKWLFETQSCMDAGRFVVGVRKSLSLAVHVPATILIFFVLIWKNSLPASTMTAVTYYLVVRLAASWYTTMERHFPFTVPFARISAIENANLFFMIGYSFLVTTALFFSYGNIGRLLMVNLSALILLGLLEYFSPRIINKRVRLSG